MVSASPELVAPTDFAVGQERGLRMQTSVWGGTRYALILLVVGTVASRRAGAEIGDLAADRVFGQSSFSDGVAGTGAVSEQRASHAHRWQLGHRISEGRARYRHRLLHGQGEFRDSLRRCPAATRPTQLPGASRGIEPLSVYRNQRQLPSAIRITVLHDAALLPHRPFWQQVPADAVTIAGTGTRSAPGGSF